MTKTISRIVKRDFIKTEMTAGLVAIFPEAILCRTKKVRGTENIFFEAVLLRSDRSNVIITPEESTEK